MGDLKERLALVICTKDRPEEFTDLLRSIARQTILPFETIVVDGGKISVEGITRQFSIGQIQYLCLKPPSLTRQRNLGIRHLHSDSTLVAFLDDDLVLADDAIEKMLLFWERTPQNIGGTSFNITNYQLTRIQKIKSLFFLDSKEKGILLRSGVGTAYFPANKTREVKWLCGGATVWRREIFQENLFDEFFYELGWNEDVEFSYRVGKHCKLFVVADAKVIHKESQTSRINNFCFGQIQTIHRLYFVKKHGKPFSVALCTWACFGQMLTNFMKGFLECNPGLLMRSFGNGFGLVRAAVGRMTIWNSYASNKNHSS